MFPPPKDDSGRIVRYLFQFTCHGGSWVTPRTKTNHKGCVGAENKGDVLRHRGSLQVADSPTQHSSRQPAFLAGGVRSTYLIYWFRWRPANPLDLLLDHNAPAGRPQGCAAHVEDRDMRLQLTRRITVLIWMAVMKGVVLSKDLDADNVDGRDDDVYDIQRPLVPPPAPPSQSMLRPPTDSLVEDLRGCNERVEEDEQEPTTPLRGYPLPTKPPRSYNPAPSLPPLHFHGHCDLNPTLRLGIRFHLACGSGCFNLGRGTSNCRRAAFSTSPFAESNEASIHSYWALILPFRRRST
ncbi:hypothetical protein BDN72DRAFT_902509 [Pluteus cervinus]|uniref:Uncharacterized protein n=1 Tax=Pluteus cervinus TaxID=181527 RepID=A0ACD3ACL7_9AGAR|nr:hypothetical protein BDN72DRAFT_902509 [Pluteus cervinus]